MRRAVSAEAEEAEVIRLSVSSAICRSIEPVSVSEAEASLIASITSPSAVEFRNRRVDGVAPGVRGPFRGLPMQGHRVRHVEGDDLRHDFGPLSEFGGGETVCACQRIERPAQDGVPGRTANPRVEADLSLPLDGAPARFGVASIEIAAQQRLEVRELELGDRFTMRRHALPDRQFQNAVDDLFDRPVDGRRNDRPHGGKDRTDAIVDLVEGASGFEFGN
jgi:hypothetical protein